MKKAIVWLGIITCLVMGVFAEDNGAIGLYGSYWKPKTADHAFAPGIRVVATGDELGYLELRASFFPGIEDKDDSDIKVDVMPIEGVIAYHLINRETFKLYTGGSIGYFSMDGKSISKNVSLDFDGEWGFGLLTGMEYRMTETISIFGEGLYRWLEITGRYNTEDLEFETDVDVDGFGANLGLMFRF